MTVRTVLAGVAMANRYAWAGVAAVLVCGLQMPAAADSRAIGFENPPYMMGSIDAQDGWGGSGIPINPSIDQAVTNAAAHSGTQSFRMSSYYTNGSFGDWVFSPSLVTGAGESGAAGDGYASGPFQPRFTATVYFRSATGMPQNSHVTIAPDRGDGARMSWIQVSDQIVPPGDGRSGLSVTFQDYEAPTPDDFVFSVVATDLDRSQWHRIDVEMEFYSGPGNDVVRVSVDGGPPVRGTSWEDYFRNQEGNPTRPVDSLLFQSRGSPEGNQGEGFLFDDVSYASTACLAATRYVAGTGDDTFNDCRDSSVPCRTVQRANDVACVGDAVNVIGCLTDSNCDDGLVCNGQETCNPTTGLCQSGTPLPDTDGDGVCDVIDNCPTVFNPGQSETSGVGDVCAAGGLFTPTAGLNLKRVRLQTSVRPNAQGNQGQVRVKALVDETLLGAPIAKLLTGGAVVGITGGGLPAVEKIVFQAPRCIQQSARMFKCIGTLAEIATFRRKGKTSTYTMRLNATQRSFIAPLSGDPVDVVLTIGGEDRADSVSCRLLGSSGGITRCRK